MDNNLFGFFFFGQLKIKRIKRNCNPFGQVENSMVVLGFPKLKQFLTWNSNHSFRHNLKIL